MFAVGNEKYIPLAEMEEECKEYPVNDSDIFCIGDIGEILVFNYKKSVWSKVPYS
jgi:hypothetical protein